MNLGPRNFLVLRVEELTQQSHLVSDSLWTPLFCLSIYIIGHMAHCYSVLCGAGTGSSILWHKTGTGTCRPMVLCQLPEPGLCHWPLEFTIPAPSRSLMLALWAKDTSPYFVVRSLREHSSSGSINGNRIHTRRWSSLKKTAARRPPVPSSPAPPPPRDTLLSPWSPLGAAGKMTRPLKMPMHWMVAPDQSLQIGQVEAFPKVNRNHLMAMTPMREHAALQSFLTHCIVR